MSRELLFADGEIDHELTDGLVCPHCGYEDRDAWEYQSDDGEAECPECGRDFWYSRHISVSYSTKPLKRDSAPPAPAVPTEEEK